MALCFALFSLAGWTAIWLDCPSSRRVGRRAVVPDRCCLAAAAVLMIPGAAGHAAQTAPRGFSLLFDWLHLASGSLWLGGLLGLLVLWFALGRDAGPGAGVVVPRFSNVAFVSVLVLLGTGTGATIFHMPASTRCGNRVRRRDPRQDRDPHRRGALAPGTCCVSSRASRPRSDHRSAGAAAVRLLRLLISGEAVLVAGAVFAAAVLSSLAPPPPAFALENTAVANVGPGRVAATVKRGGYVLQVLVTPNKAAAPDHFALRITKDGRPVSGASVTLTFNHLEMQMPQQEYQLTETRPGVYSRAAPALIMVGKWGLGFTITPKTGPSFTALIVDQANG